MIFITGASGFLGQALVCRTSTISANGVIAAVRQKQVNLPPQVPVVHGYELVGETNWMSALQGVRVVVHCAARAHVLREKSADPLEDFRAVNVAGTLNLARQAASSGVKRFLFISSIGVNGNSTVAGRPFSHEDDPYPHDYYAVSKYEAEQALLALSAETGMEVVIIRPPLVYGPNAPGNFGKLLDWVGRGVPLPLRAVRENRRSFIALDNLVDLIIRCVEHPAAANQIFLAGDGEDLSTAELLERLGRAMGKPARLIPVPVWMLWSGATVLGKRAVAQRLLGSLQVNIAKTREVLGWEPPVGVDEGLRRAVGQYRAVTML